MDEQPGPKLLHLNCIWSRGRLTGTCGLLETRFYPSTSTPFAPCKINTSMLQSAVARTRCLKLDLAARSLLSRPTVSGRAHLTPFARSISPTLSQKYCQYSTSAVGTATIDEETMPFNKSENSSALNKTKLKSNVKGTVCYGA